MNEKPTCGACRHYTTERIALAIERERRDKYNGACRELAIPTSARLCRCGGADFAPLPPPPR